MYGTINKRAMTKSAFTNAVAITEVYVDKNFSWENDTAWFYIRHNNSVLNLPALIFKLNNIWGTGKCQVYVARSFDSILLEGKVLLFHEGKWADV